MPSPETNGGLTEPAVATRERHAANEHSWVRELVLRLLGAILQILATWAIVHALAPQAAGVYFRGVAIALGLSTLLRGKYEIYLARHIIGRRAAADGIPNALLVMQFARRVLLRCSFICGALLVLTADLDIQAPQLQAVLQTYLPFVLALPCTSLALLLGEALRAANRTLGIVLTTYAMNLSMLLAVALAPANASLALYSWAFLLGSIAAAGVAVALARNAFRGMQRRRYSPISLDVLQAADSMECIGLGRGLLLWGPQCILAAWAPAIQVAQYAVLLRTALIIDFFLPALNLTGCRETLRPAPSVQAPRSQLMRQLAVALVCSSVLVAPLVALAPAILGLYGKPYDSQLTIYVLLLAVQWANGLGRPAVRHAVVGDDRRGIGIAVGSGAAAVVLLCTLSAVTQHTLYTAAAALIGGLIVNGRAIAMAIDSPAAADSRSASGVPPSC